MRKIVFTKMVASGNDFIVVDSLSRYLVISHKKLAQKICNRKYGVGADGLLVLEKSKVADVKMRVFNPDGSEAKMCGNGARCVGLLIGAQRTLRRSLPRAQSRGSGQATHDARHAIETKAGVIESEVRKNNVKIKLTEPKNLKLNIPIKVNRRLIRVNFINTGVPHTVLFVEGLDKIDIVNLGRQLRFHAKFAPVGTNVDFVELLSKDTIKIRTYERGVEDETLACGTGAVASALLTTYNLPVLSPSTLLGINAVEGQLTTEKINVLTKSGEVLGVYFKRDADKFKDVWLEGEARIVYKGRWCDEPIRLRSGFVPSDSRGTNKEHRLARLPRR